MGDFDDGLADELAGVPEAPTESRVGRSSNVRRGGRLSLALQLGGMGLRFISEFVLARWMGVVAFGAYAYAINLGNLLATPAALGFDGSVLRFVPQYDVGKSGALLRGFLRTSRLIPVAFAAIMGVVGVSAVVVWGPGPSERWAMVAALAAVPLFSLFEIQTGIIRGFRRIFAAFFPQRIAQPLLLVGSVAVVAAVGLRPSASLVTFLMAATIGALVLIQAVVIHRSARLRISTPGGTKPARIVEFREWLGVSLPLLVQRGVQLVYQRADLLMVGALLGAREAGIYAVAWRIGALAAMFQTAMNAAVAPTIAELYWSKDRDRVEHELLGAIRWAFLPSLVLTAVLIGAGGPVLALFGPQFREGWAALTFYALGQLTSVSQGSVGWTMSLTGHHRTSALVNISTAALAMAGYFLLIPRIGIVGAAIANAGSIALKNVWMNQLVRRKLGYRISVRRALFSRTERP